MEMKEITTQELIEENRRRNAALPENRPYDPETGEGGIGDRRRATDPDGREVFLPTTMLADADYPRATGRQEWMRLRCRHDFEYWCITCVRIKHKTTGRDVPFRLNAPQRHVASLLEEDRLAGRPLRMIMLKARQWGGSTLVQMYMAWIQSVHRRNWHSLICAHVKDTAGQIRGMYTRMLSSYPEGLWDGDEAPAFKPFERSTNVREITGRGCRVTIASAESQESVRGFDFAMAHLSETAFWPHTPRHSPDDMIRAVCGAVAYEPLTLVVMESTANGVGNYFHREWLRAEKGESDKRAVFVPWHAIEIYRLPVADDEVEGLWASLTDDERRLWQQGLTLEMIHWYHCKAREYQSAAQMHAEFPGDAVEAFTLSGASVFDATRVEELRRGVRPPALVGEIGLAGVPVADSRGALQVWEKPQRGTQYVAAMDIGGRTDGADWSVVAVLSCTPQPRVVAQWRGHIDHDLLADRAMALATYYNTALLVVESNTLESEAGLAMPDNSLSVLDRMRCTYPNLYTRAVTDRLTDTVTDRVGFHTNRRTKPLLISGLIAAVRDGTYTERCATACDELRTYCQLPNGSYAARPGCHDDVLMTRALALHAIAGESPMATPTPPPPPPLRW